jgi:MFS family permease
MTIRQIKTGYFAVQWLNSFGTSFYFYYLFFVMEKRYGFGNLENLFIAAVNGFIYTFAAWYGGRFGQRHGYFTALGLGFSIMIAALCGAGLAGTAAAQFGWMILWTIGVCFTWPALEALVTEGETPLGVQRMVGTYNLSWSGASALAYFTGGAIVEKMGLQSIYWLPAVLHGGQIVLLLWLRTGLADAGTAPGASQPLEIKPSQPELTPRPIARTRAFLRMAWTANPFAYVAIYTLAAVIPTLAHELNLTPMMAGFFGSIWFFTRWFTFLALWLWPGWHYRAGWFFAAYVLLIVSFLVLLLVPQLAVLVVAQIGFGIAVGLIYYSSLFYSMDVSESKGEHGGIHEAAIGFGIFLGPAVGAASIRIFPAAAHGAAFAVASLLGIGLVLLLSAWKKARV